MVLKKVTSNRIKPAFTYLELILYVAITSIFISGVVLFAWDMIYGQVKSGIQQDVSHNLRLASKRISYEIRNASSINLVGQSYISLSLSESSRNPTVFDISDERLRIGFGSSGACPVSNPCYLTSGNVAVTDLSFTDLSDGTGESVNINFSVTVEGNSTSQGSDWQKSQTYSSSVELRSN